MSGVVDLSPINDFYVRKIRCVTVHKLEDLNYMLQHKWVVSVYHDTIARTVVYYIDDTDGDGIKHDTQICS